MTIRFGGQSYTAQCPVCDAGMSWKGARGAAERIAAAAPHHERGCPVVGIDPARLRRIGRREAVALAAERRSDDDPT